MFPNLGLSFSALDWAILGYKDQSRGGHCADQTFGWEGNGVMTAWTDDGKSKGEKAA
jgi:hypothetical protein